MSKYRDDKTRAELFELQAQCMEYIPKEKHRSTSGTWARLHYYGNPAFDAMEVLIRDYLTIKDTQRLAEIICRSEREKYEEDRAKAETGKQASA